MEGVTLKRSLRVTRRICQPVQSVKKQGLFFFSFFEVKEKVAALLPIY